MDSLISEEKCTKHRTNRYKEQRVLLREIHSDQGKDPGFVGEGTAMGP